MWYAGKLGLPSLNTIDWVARTAEMCFLTLLGAGSPRSRCWQVWFLQTPLLGLELATFLLCAHTLIICVCTCKVSSSYKGSHAIGIGTYPMTSCSLNYLFRGPIVRYIHIGASTYDFFRGTHVSPEHDSFFLVNNDPISCLRKLALWLWTWGRGH